MCVGGNDFAFSDVFRPCVYIVETLMFVKISKVGDIDDPCPSNFSTQTYMEVMTIGMSELTIRVPLTLYASKKCSTPLQCIGA